MDFWMPTYKYEYVEWLERHYAKNRNGEKIKWVKFPIKRLKAIYIGIRKDNENAHASPNQSVGLRQKQIQNSPIYGNAPREDTRSNTMEQNQKGQIYFDFSTQSNASLVEV